MKRSTLVCLVLFAVLAILHQDVWNWDNRGLVFGFMPVGLAYHALYSVAAALFWLGVSRFAWPVEIERWADEEPGM
jgi:hypothetical protein